jgi:hypothetical protein
MTEYSSKRQVLEVLHAVEHGARNLYRDKIVDDRSGAKVMASSSS